MFDDPSADDRTDALAGPASDAGPEETYLGAVVEYDDAPDECTIYPADIPGERLVTTWLSASGGAFVALDDVR